MTFDGAGKTTGLKVMGRPLEAVNQPHMKMKPMLEFMQAAD